MFINCRLETIYPPPSLRDTSAGGGHRMTFSAIATQPLRGNDKQKVRFEKLSAHQIQQLFAAFFHNYIGQPGA